jgi:hypothetical protein
VKGVVPGWASTVLPIYFLGGVQILCLGIIGEYVGKMYMETKRRPRYHIETLRGSRLGLGSGKVAPDCPKPLRGMGFSRRSSIR